MDARTRLRLGLTFGLFETAMPILGLLLGHSLAAALGQGAHWIGADLLIATGLYSVIRSVRKHSAGDESEYRTGGPGPPTWRLLVNGAALSIDNLAVGFALTSPHVSIAVAAIVIGVVCLGMSLIGMELGSRIGSKTGERGEIIGGLVLIGVGIALAAGII